MGTIKIKLPDELEDLFRRKASKRLGARKGAVTSAGVAAVSRYSGVEPSVVLVVEDSQLSIEASTDFVEEVLNVIIQNAEVQVTTPSSSETVKKILGKVDVSYASERYTAFKCRLERGRMLVRLRSFRAEWDGKELIYDDGCMLLSLRNFNEALGIAENVAPILRVTIPRLTEENHLEIYKWAEAQEQEVITR